CVGGPRQLRRSAPATDARLPREPRHLGRDRRRRSDVRRARNGGRRRGLRRRVLRPGRRTHRLTHPGGARMRRSTRITTLAVVLGAILALGVAAASAQTLDPTDDATDQPYIVLTGHLTVEDGTTVEDA